MADDPLGVDQGNLADKAQDVVHKSAAGHDKLIGGEFPWRQVLEIHVGFDLGMVLLTEGMPLVQFDDLLIREVQAGPPPFKFDVRLKEQLPFSVDGPLDNPYNPAKGDGSLYIVGVGEGVFLLYAEHLNPFAGTRSADFPLCQAVCRPGMLVLGAGVPLDDVVNPFMPGEFRQIGNGVVGRVGAKQHLLVAELTDSAQGVTEEVDESVQGML